MIDIITKFNVDVSSALLGVAGLIFLVRVIFFLISQRDSGEIILALRDIVLFVVLSFSFTEVYEIIVKIPDYFTGAIKGSGKDFASLLKVAMAGKEINLLFVGIGADEIIGLRLSIVNFCKWGYTSLVLLGMSFYSVVVFSSTLLRMPIIGKALLGIAIFVGMYPLYFILVDTIFLTFLADVVKSPSPNDVGSLVLFSVFLFLLVPVATLKSTLFLVDPISKKAGQLFRTKTGIGTGSRLIGSGLKSVLRLPNKNSGVKPNRFDDSRWVHEKNHLNRSDVKQKEEEAFRALGSSRRGSSLDIVEEEGLREYSQPGGKRPLTGKSVLMIKGKTTDTEKNRKSGTEINTTAKYSSIDKKSEKSSKSISTKQKNHTPIKSVRSEVVKKNKKGKTYSTKSYRHSNYLRKWTPKKRNSFSERRHKSTRISNYKFRKRKPLGSNKASRSRDDLKE